MSMEAALQTYIAESRDLLESMEAALLELEGEGRESPREHLNAIFRAAHTIKGSAGLFGLDDIVGFTHGVETTLDLLREDEALLSDALIALLLKCGDHLTVLIDELDAGNAKATPEQRQYGQALNDQLSRCVGTPAPAATGPADDDPMAAYFNEHFEGASTGSAVARRQNTQGQHPFERVEGEAAITDHWHISLRFGRDSLRDGMDPLSFLGYLQTLGEIVSIATLDDDLPPAAEMDPESCYLGFEIAFKSDADKQTIEDVFEFIREESRVRILPPHSLISEYIQLIEALPEADMRLGEILVECGSLTRHELDEALAYQQASEENQVRRPLGEILVERGNAAGPVVDAAVEKQAAVREKSSRENQSIRVDAARLDELINLIGELVTSGAGTSLNARETGDSAMMESVANLTSLIEDVRDAALKLRMVQIGATFNRFKRIVRDVSLELGKDIQLDIRGAETELDKTVVEKIGDPLMHLIRNAIDHGVEPAAVRAERGKPVAGSVTLNAYHDSGTIVIEVSDDGGGIDPERVRLKAIEKGLIQDDQVLDTKELLELIFAPGFSTAAEVTNLSGRGVGMDVVKSNITELGGRVEVDSELEKGTTFRIFMPLTLAIIDGFLIGVQDASFVIPLECVLECVELPEEDIESAAHRDYMNLRHEVLPFIRLRDMFALTSKPPKRENVVVVRHRGHKAGLVVDRLMGEFQTVIKPLGPIFSQLEGVSGSTIMGNGDVALILDVPNLIQQIVQKEQCAMAR